MKITDTKKKIIQKILTRGVENIYPSKNALEKVLLSGKKLKIYHGIDPTGKLHIGHGVSLRKLRQFQDLGHDIIVLIGNFTARIGDPTDKTATRKKLSKKEVASNTLGYKKLIGKILDLKKLNVRFLHNEKWTNKLTPEDFLELASHFTVSRLLERHMFQNRIKEGKEIRLHEFLYPVFQAYDSVTMNVDLEIGGNDQTFNMLAGRTLLKKLKNKEKFVLSLKLLTSPDGKKMGKTEGVKINIDEPASEMYGKIMALPDSSLIDFFTLCTDEPEEEIERMKKVLDVHTSNPRDLKMKLARSVVAEYHSAKEADAAEKEFVSLFQQKAIPERIETVTVTKWPRTLTEAVVAAELCTSTNEARRLISQGGIKINGVVEKNPAAALPDEKAVTISRGKRHFKKLVR
ncbi:tyrosine--tRNA ligase [Candidatus Uhrbacteria bacterium CG10_big_fil_rev_8_21_14_0_10_48_11]|uniref:Tyrosine--tRNA ligase n=1 Tax=Candidatus Uhrbacteria bacterium CG10_big_fil_rev_8_21_14_0_10_48_11 TaxID=1975037 RepID=A0A2M8LF37_9BACT|nr:MAG: tyrosine--tRNA ligase [Candidatus Uhrbacteria bacterium CG10_big_fil_rev_8_21_14_0_10_48_11]